MQFTNKVCAHQESSQGFISNWKGLPRLDPYNCVVDLLFFLLELKSLFSLIFLKTLFLINLLSVPVEGLLSL